MTLKPSSFLSFILLIVVYQLHGQKHTKVTFYQNLDLISVTERRSNNAGSFENYRTSYQANITRPSFGISWDFPDNRNRNELEISFSRFPALEHGYVNSFPNRSSKPNKIFSSIDYSVSRRLIEGSKSIAFYCGLNVTGYFYSLLDNPSKGYQTLERSLGIMAGVNPRLIFLRKRRLTMEVGSKIMITDFRNYLYLSDDPRIGPSDQRRHEWTRLSVFPKVFNLRLGISYALGTPTNS